MLRDALEVIGGILIAMAINVVAVLLPRPRRWELGVLAISLSASTLTIPFVIDAPPAVKTCLATLIGIGLFRVLEAARVPERLPTAVRLLHVLTPLDRASMKRVPRRLQLRRALKGILFAAIGLAGFIFGSRLAPPTAPYATLAAWPRWLAAGAGGYFIFEGLSEMTFVPLEMLGWHHVPVQDAPIRSRSVGEFWGRRWNRVVGTWLRRNVFDPLARRRHARVGIVATFLVSGLLHAYSVLPGSSIVPALWIGLFFVVHGALVLLESALGIARWPRWRAHAFTIASFVATVPLFIEPFLRALGL